MSFCRLMWPITWPINAACMRAATAGEKAMLMHPCTGELVDCISASLQSQLLHINTIFTHASARRYDPYNRTSGKMHVSAEKTAAVLLNLNTQKPFSFENAPPPFSARTHISPATQRTSARRGTYSTFDSASLQRSGRSPLRSSLPKSARTYALKLAPALPGTSVNVPRGA